MMFENRSDSLYSNSVNTYTMNGDVVQTVVETKRMAFTKQQLKDVRKFKADLKEGKHPEFIFEGTMLEGVTLLEGAKKVVDACFY